MREEGTDTDRDTREEDDPWLFEEEPEGPEEGSEDDPWRQDPEEAGELEDSWVDAEGSAPEDDSLGESAPEDGETGDLGWGNFEEEEDEEDPFEDEEALIDVGPEGREEE